MKRFLFILLCHVAKVWIVERRRCWGILSTREPSQCIEFGWRIFLRRLRTDVQVHKKFGKLGGPASVACQPRRVEEWEGTEPVVVGSRESRASRAGSNTGEERSTIGTHREKESQEESRERKGSNC